MVAVDSNILIGILVILSVVAYIFVLRRMKTRQPNPVDTATSIKTGEEAMTDDRDTTDQQTDESPKKTPVTKCGHYFGYLSSLSKKSEHPEECLGCSKMTKCMSRKKPRKARGKRTKAVLAIDEETETLKE